MGGCKLASLLATRTKSPSKISEQRGFGVGQALASAGRHELSCLLSPQASVSNSWQRWQQHSHRSRPYHRIDEQISFVKYIECPLLSATFRRQYKPAKLTRLLAKITLTTSPGCISVNGQPGDRFYTTQSFARSSNSMAKIISGKEVADEIRAKLKAKVETLSIKPKLVIVQVGGREDSNVYIRMKTQFAESIGASAELVKLARDVTEEELASKIRALNQDTSVHGVITQLPFDCSTKINSDYIVNLIDPMKDVDGLSIYNAGKLSHGELNRSSFVPCTPNGCMELIRKSGIKIEGSHAVVIGRSKIVGSPMAQLLLWHNSTVTMCHSKTKNIEELCRQADILVAAVGRAQMVKASWLKPGAVVIDCGINVIPDATKKSGTRLVGDVDFDHCKEVASAITPVPGGVGPMTVAMLISNTVESASRVVAQTL